MTYVLMPYFTAEQVAQLGAVPGRQEKIDLGERFRKEMADAIVAAIPEVTVSRVTLVFIQLEIPQGRQDLVDAIAALTGYVPYPGGTLICAP